MVSVDDSNGTWQYSALGDGNWQDFGSVDSTHAVLLGASSKIRFVPDANYNGSGGQIEFQAWDQTTGKIGDADVNVSTTGGTEAYSTTTDSASISVAAVNDQPTLAMPTNAMVNEDTSLAISGISVSDVDAASVRCR